MANVIGKRNQAKPWDFNDESEWNSYNEGREANPKVSVDGWIEVASNKTMNPDLCDPTPTQAAYAYGLKMKDGRRQKTNKMR